jgi:hypothetical protein
VTSALLDLRAHERAPPVHTSFACQVRRAILGTARRVSCPVPISIRAALRDVSSAAVGHLPRAGRAIRILLVDHDDRPRRPDTSARALRARAVTDPPKSQLDAWLVDRLQRFAGHFGPKPLLLFREVSGQASGDQQVADPEDRAVHSNCAPTSNSGHGPATAAAV